MTEVKIGTVKHYFPKAHAAVVAVEAERLHLGDKVHFVGHGTDHVETIKSLQLEHEPIEEARPGQEVGVLVSDKVHEKADVLKIVE